MVTRAPSTVFQGSSCTFPLLASITHAGRLTPRWHVLQHWGYYYSALTPAAVVNSGDTIVVETSTQHGGDDYDKIVRGDSGMEVCTFCLLQVIPQCAAWCTAHCNERLMCCT